MSASNTIWRITWGDYDFALDRKTLTYDLTETQTGTVWATALPVGWIELENRATGERVRHDFADAKLISVAEKSSAQGKRLLLGLDLLGIPIDLYFICSQREIQLTVEASRDTREYLVQEAGLLPGLVSVPNDGEAYAILPHHDGQICKADYFGRIHSMPVWEPMNGLSMPFVGAKRGVNGDSSAIVLVTDSAYACFDALRADNDAAEVNLRFNRDPERRRLEAKINLLPHGDYVKVARAYRDKIIAEKNHITLRKKMRDRPFLEAAFREEEIDLKKLQMLNLRAYLPPDSYDGLWEYHDKMLHTIDILQKEGWAVALGHFVDWCAIAVDFQDSIRVGSPKAIPVPLLSVVYHDSVIMPHGVRAYDRKRFLNALIACAPRWPASNLPDELQFYQLSQAVLGPLYKLTFSAFLAAHSFVTTDLLVEEANYSDKTQVVVNKSAINSFERDDLHLPAWGFYVRHAQMEAHFALRVGEQTFDTPAWRIRRARDGKRLEESEDILYQEFPVESVEPV